jgi:hypothetical protein
MAAGGLTTTPFDTLNFVERLKAAGVPGAWTTSGSAG